MKLFQRERVGVDAVPRIRHLPGKIIERHLIDPGPPVEQLVDQLHLQEVVRLVFEDLSNERRTVLALTFGIHARTGSNCDTYTLDEIARVIHRTRESVAGLQAINLSILRNRRWIVDRLKPFAHLLNK